MIRGLVLLIVLVAVGVPLVFWLSARRALDPERTHTRRTEALPFVGDTSGDGLVRIPTARGTFRGRVAGLAGSGPALLLLHGFPETSIMWEPLIEAARDAGYRVAAFDQRGYSPTLRPEGVDDYALPELLADAIAVADSVGFERFHLVGHDWGAIVGWGLAAESAQRVITYTSLSIPHPGAILAGLGDAPAPLYSRIFRLPGVPEAAFAAFDFALMKRAVYNEMPPDVLAEYLTVFREPGALRAAFQWYRASPFDPSARALPDLEVEVPVLWVWGRKDLPFLTDEKAREAMPRFVRGRYREEPLDAGHWLIQEQPDVVVRLVMEQIGSR
jgi:pimeloyl-ACP methyl ester carboxylesterase